MSNTTQELIQPPDTPIEKAPETAACWREWAKKRAQNAPGMQNIREISKKVKINVTNMILEERQEN